MSASSPEPHPPPPSRRLLAYSLFAAFGVVAIALATVGLKLALTDPDNCGAATAGAPIGGALALTDQFGRQRAVAREADSPLLVYFGYTYCPDICPIDVAHLSEAVYVLDDAGLGVTPVFVTIDPARDTVATLADFAAPFHPRLLALTGSDEDIATAAGNWRVFYGRGEGDDEYYLMDHSTLTYLANRRGEYVAHFSHGTAPETIAAAVQCHADAGRIEAAPIGG